MSLLYPNGIRGLSDSKWSGTPGAAARLVGIDIHSTPGLIKVRQKLSKYSPASGGNEVTELCKQKIGASNGTTLWFSAESGKIWREVSGTFTLVHTTVPTAGEAKCLGAAEFDGWIYWATEKYLHRIHIDDINGTWSYFVYQNWDVFAVGDSEAHPMAEQNLELFIGDKTALAKISDGTTAAPNPTDTFTTTLGASVLWLTLGGLIKPSGSAFPVILASARSVDSYPKVGVTCSITALVVGGGGGGGGNGGGGGGAGQFLEDSYAIDEGSHSITIGAGGTGQTGNGQGSDGGSSSLGSAATAVGGGGGGGAGTVNGRTGASGGGAARTGTGGTGTAGNNGASDTDTFSTGGGGGAGAAGQSGSSGNGGLGGNGSSSSISGSSVTYAGGGGGGAALGASSGASGGSGGGGAGGNSSQNGVAGTANRGGGGGGGGESGANGADGGSGVVIISYPTGTLNATGGTITTAGGNTIHTFTTNGTFTVFKPQTTYTQSFAVPAGHNKALFILVANYTSAIPQSATFNGVAMTAVTGGGTVSSGGLDVSHRIFRLLNPDAVTGNVVVTWSSPGASNVVLHIVAVDGVDQSSPTTGFATNNGTSISATLALSSSASYQLRLALCVSATATHTQASTQTQLQAGTNSVGNDSSSYIGVTADFGFTAETDFNLKAPERITTLEPYDVDLLIGTRIPNKNAASVKRWDTISPSWSAEDQIDEDSINAFIRDDNYMYVQAGSAGRLYFYNGEQLLPYKRVPGDWSPTQAGVVHPAATATLLGVPVFGLSNVAGNPTLQGVYSLGSYSKDYEKVLDLSFPISAGVLVGVTIGAVLVKGADLMVAWKTATSAGIDKLDYTAKYAGAYIETVLLANEERRLLKTLTEACAYYASLPADTGITIGHKRKYDANYTSLDMVTDPELCQVKAKQSVTKVANLQLRFGFTVSGNNAPEVENFAYQLAPLQK